MKKIKTYLFPYRLQCVLAPLFKLLEACMDLLVPLVVAKIIDQGIAQADQKTLFSAFALLIGLAALGLGFSVTAQWFSAKASTGFAADVRQGLFDHVQALSYTQLDRIGADTLITRMTSDVNQMQTGVNMGLRLLLRSPFIVFGSLVMALLIDVRCALVFAAAIPILGAVVYGIMRASIPLYRKVQSSLDRVLETTRENLTGVRVIRAFHKEKDQIAAFDRENEELTRLNEFVGKLSAALNPLTYVLINIATVVLIRVGAIRVDGGWIGQGAVVALYNYTAQMIVELIKLAALTITINKALACAHRVENVLEETPDMVYPETPVQPLRTDEAVRFENVSFSYAGGGAEALSNVSFSVRRGQTVGVIGGTGSGKTTLIQLIARFYDVTAGALSVFGVNVKDYPKGDLPAKIGIVQQKAVLFAGTVRDNLTFGAADADDGQIWAALDTAQAMDVVRAKEAGLDSRVEQNGKNYSGGQKQRLTIARALVRDPEILILDDAASALDYVTDAKLRKALRSYGKEKTVFLVSQRAASIRDADLILVLNDGKLVGQGTHEELLHCCQVYREIYASQFPEEVLP